MLENVMCCFCGPLFAAWLLAQVLNVRQHCKALQATYDPQEVEQ